MMPDLGAYATEIFAAYAVSFVLLAAITIRSIVRAQAVKQALAQKMATQTEQADGA